MAIAFDEHLEPNGLYPSNERQQGEPTTKWTAKSYKPWFSSAPEVTLGVL